MTFPQLLTAILQVAQLNVVAADLNELARAPLNCLRLMLDPSGSRQFNAMAVQGLAGEPGRRNIT